MLLTASDILTSFGKTALAFAVDSLNGGMHTVKLNMLLRLNLIVLKTSFLKLQVIPPNISGATLSGCPSIFDEIWNISSTFSNISFAINTPATMQDALEPRPLDVGIF